jgi:hypothetical protein
MRNRRITYQMVIWQVDPNPRPPQGIRYRLALIQASEKTPGEKTPAVLYDNHHPKRHHRHIEGVEPMNSLTLTA